MPNWGEVLKEIQLCEFRDPLDRIRRKYLDALATKTGRNVIAYYSGWLQHPDVSNTAVGDDDKNALMAAVHGLDRSKGLDLLLHTPGGDLAATESIVDYLHKMFNGDIRAVVPQLAMSAGTMIACSCREIVMGKQSNLGPIDPQFGGIPAHGVLKEFEEAIAAVKADPASISIWQVVVGKYHPTFIGECRHALTWSSDMVREWLKRSMFAGMKDATKRATNAVKYLGDHDYTKSHARHIPVEEAEKLLKVLRLEDDDEMQDLVLTVHHSFMHTFANSAAVKIVENHKGGAMLSMRGK
ncbi:MAG: S49 family peptidase [Verrucomicrobiota bacterium]